MRTLPNGKRVMRQSGNAIFLAGNGASQKGEFPFLDRFDLQHCNLIASSNAAKDSMSP